MRDCCGPCAPDALWARQNNKNPDGGLCGDV